MAHVGEKWEDDLEVAAISDRGMRRANNQDSFLVALAESEATWHRRGHSFTVADGMGAHAAGELASKLAADHLAPAYNQREHLFPPEALRQAISATNAIIFQRGQSRLELHGMGTTCSHLVLLPQGALVGHVGDSRVYRLRGRRLDQLTFDHSLAWEIAAAQKRANSSVQMNVPTNVITRSLGPHPQVEVDLEGPFPTREGDTFLLCSDGLSGVVEDQEIGTLLGCLSVEEAAQTLVDLANLRTGPDNITVIVARVKGSRLVSPKGAGKQGSLSWDAPLPGELADPASFALKILAGVGVLIGVMLASFDRWALAGACWILGIALGWAAKLRRSALERVSERVHPLGEGPHRTYEIEPEQAFVDNLSLLVRQFREAVKRNGWAIEEPLFDDLEKRAVAAADAGDLAAAVVCQAEAVRAMMQTLRRHGSKLPSDA